MIGTISDEVFISPFTDEQEFLCFGTCYCELGNVGERQEDSDLNIESAHVLKKTVETTFSAANIDHALHVASERFEEICAQELAEACQNAFIFSHSEKCERRSFGGKQIDAIDQEINELKEKIEKLESLRKERIEDIALELNEDFESTWPKAYDCIGYCVADDRWRSDPQIAFIEDFDCSRLVLQKDVIVMRGEYSLGKPDDFYETPQEIAKKKFHRTELRKYCKVNSNIGFYTDPFTKESKLWTHGSVCAEKAKDDSSQTKCTSYYFKKLQA